MDDRGDIDLMQMDKPLQAGKGADELIEVLCELRKSQVRLERGVRKTVIPEVDQAGGVFIRALRKHGRRWC